jgi:DNA polymerase elongation subunit (family B)
MWLTKAGATENEYEQLATEVSKQVGIDLSLEGIYNWILFPTSKIDPRLPTANRYVGWYTNGEIKIRGIEVRRRDTPIFIKRLQGEMLKVMGEATDLHGIELRVPVLLSVARDFITVLRQGKADPMELVIHCHLRREPEEYTTNTVNASAAKALDEAGIHLAAGEMVEYVVVDASGKRAPWKARPVALYSLDDGYDIEFYTTLALKAVESLLMPFGYSVETLRRVFHADTKKQKRTPIQSTQLTLFTADEENEQYREH